jgi:hypothetical protein
MERTEEESLNWIKACIERAKEVFSPNDLPQVIIKKQKSITFWESKLYEAENSLNIDKTMRILRK